MGVTISNMFDAPGAPGEVKTSNHTAKVPMLYATLHQLQVTLPLCRPQSCTPPGLEDSGLLFLASTSGLVTQRFALF